MEISEKALADIKKDLSQVETGRQNKLSSSRLINKLFDKHERHPISYLESRRETQ